MTSYVADHETGSPLCTDCATGQCRPVDGWRCQAEHCQCLCRADSWPDDADRARELDDRPADKLAVVAADLDRERTPDLRELTAERYGGGGRRADQLDPATLRAAAARADSMERTARKHITAGCECRSCLIYHGQAAQAVAIAADLRTAALRAQQVTTR